eukprot:3907905-Amphidinium_carterae.1
MHTSGYQPLAEKYETSLRGERRLAYSYRRQPDKSHRSITTIVQKRGSKKVGCCAPWLHCEPKVQTEPKFDSQAVTRACVRSSVSWQKSIASV